MADPQAFRNSRPLPTPSGLKPGSLLGRFELKRQLGSGAQSTVWLAHDPRMEREVAIKVLRSTSGADDLAVKQWLQEARSVGRVKHPSIVPVFEADIHEQYAYLVFEYVAGDTLAQILERRGALPAREAVALMMDVLDAIAVAHTEGVVHRDIKPSNILVDGSNRARVMDFGIAARVRNPADNAAVAVGGTVGYISPEALAGAHPVPSMDLFACGLVLAELLMGKPLISDTDTNRALYRTAHEQLALPESAGENTGVDDGLRSIVNRALARDPVQRFGDARTFFAALNTWRQPGEGSADAATANSGGTLDFLMRRMRHKSDFPALSESVMRIQTMATSETESVSSVTNQILRDVALTNKLLRVVNTAHFARGGSISTVSRAVTLVGFNGIRNMALSLVLLEHMKDKSHATQLKDEFVRSLLAATLGAELCGNTRDAEEGFIGAMFQNMGRLLVHFYFPEEASQISGLTEALDPPMSESAASYRILGLSYENLGLGVAKAWGLPESIQKCMQLPQGSAPPRLSPDSPERLRWLAVAANELADVLLHNEAPEVAVQVGKLARKYAPALDNSDKQMQVAVEQARARLVDMAAAMELRVKPESPAYKLLHAEPEVPADAPDPLGPGSDGNIGSLALQATVVEGLAAPAAKSKHVAETLAAGIQDITNAMVEDFKLGDVLRMILETMYRAMDLDRIIFAMRDPKTEAVTGRFGLGEGVEAVVKDFKVPLKAATPDLFAVVCIKGLDSMISDATEARIVQRLPSWYAKTLNAPAFLLLPLQIKSAPFGLIYADKTKKGALELDEKELALLRTLRNQAVMAFKQSR